MLTSTPESATVRVCRLYRQGQVKDALREAKNFRLGLTREERATLARAYECLVRPEFYRAIQWDPEQAVQDGQRVFEVKILQEG